MGSEKLICGCFNIKEGLIIHHIKNGVNTIEDLEKVTNIGVCCGRCRGKVKKLIKQYGEKPKKQCVLNKIFKNKI